MPKPLATAAQMLSSNLVNHQPVLCAVCNRFIAYRTGLPVILNDRENIVGFVHPGCCDRPKDAAA